MRSCAGDGSKRALMPTNDVGRLRAVEGDADQTDWRWLMKQVTIPTVFGPPDSLPVCAKPAVPGADADSARNDAK